MATTYSRRNARNAGVSLLALALAALALSSAPAWADGGSGRNSSAGTGGAGGVDGSLSDATGKDGTGGTTTVSGGGGGGGGVDLTTGNGAPGGVTISNPSSTIRGANGATGGTGQTVTGVTTITTSVSGGAGGAAPGAGLAGGQGGGGVGVSATADVTVAGSATVAGGAGQASGASPSFAGGAGGGGVGIFSNADVTVDAGGHVSGGAGGAGIIGGAGGGAAAIVLTGDGMVDNTGTLLGGAGGASRFVDGADGGAGVLLLSGGTVVNEVGGTITGGAGGTGPLGAGDGGAGVKGANISVVNAGTIAGGLGGSGAQADAIDFTGGVNSLEIQAGSNITGTVTAYSTADTFKLGGTTDSSFAVTDIGTKYVGFGNFDKTGSSTWTLTGTTTAVTPWTISQGTLSISSIGALGNVAGAVTFDGGTLQTTATMTNGHQLILDAGGTIDVSAGILTQNGLISGNGGLIVTGAGLLKINGNNTYLGGTTIKDGGSVAIVSSDGSLGAASGGLTFDDGTLEVSGPNVTTARHVTFDDGGGIIDVLAHSMFTMTGLLDGSGGLTKTGANTTLILAGTATYTGTTAVSQGTLQVDGDDSGATGALSVASGATLSGAGTIGGDVAIGAGGILSPGDGKAGTLTINGGLAFNATSKFNVDLAQPGVGGALNDLVNVGGDLTLDGKLNVTAPSGKTLAPGLYRLINYDGALNGPGLTFGTVTGAVVGDLSVQTSITGQVNLIDTGGMTFRYWDGDAGGRDDGTIDGGDGVWRATSDTNWTVDTGVVNSSFADQGFAVFMGAAGAVTVDDSDGAVRAGGMQFLTDGYTVSGGTITLSPPSGTQSFIEVGDGSADDAGITATIASELAGSAELVKGGGGTLILSSNNSYTGGTEIDAGVLKISSDQNLGDASGALTFDGGALEATASFTSARNITLDSGGGILAADSGVNLTLNGGIDGAGGLTKTGTGQVTLAVASTYDGATTVDAGTLAAGGMNVFNSNSVFTTNADGTLDLAGFNQSLLSLNNAGGVKLGTTPGTALTVTGDYTGSGGTVFLNAALGDDTSTTDELVIKGNSTGTSTLAVTNVGGTGAQTTNGIEVVDVTGASAGTFTLKGDYVFDGDQAVVGGAYAYRLYQGSITDPADGDWYLRSDLVPTPPSGPATPLYQPGVPLYEAYANVLQSFNKLPTLQERVGNRSWSNAGDDGQVEGSGTWGRIETSRTTFDGDTSTTGTDHTDSIWRLEGGADTLLANTSAGQLVAGVWGEYGTISSSVSGSIFGAGTITSTGAGLGGSLTWYGRDGFYVDSQAQLISYDSTLSSSTADKQLVGNNGGLGYGLSVEAGRRIGIGRNWSITPQAQLSYSAVNFNSFADTFGAAISSQGDGSLTGRLGLSADFEQQSKGADGKAGRTHVYGIANVYYDFGGGTVTDVAGIDFANKNDPLWGGVGIGGSYNWDDDKYSVYGEASANTSLDNVGQSYGFAGTGGLRVKW